jgi:hypothetical protein
MQGVQTVTMRHHAARAAGYAMIATATISGPVLHFFTHLEAAARIPESIATQHGWTMTYPDDERFTFWMARSEQSDSDGYGARDGARCKGQIDALEGMSLDRKVKRRYRHVLGDCYTKFVRLFGGKI